MVSGDLSVTGSLFVPENIHHKFCGPVFVIVEMDSTDLVAEVDEINNARAKKLTVVCAEGGFCSLLLFEPCLHLLILLYMCRFPAFNLMKRFRSLGKLVALSAVVLWLTHPLDKPSFVV